MTSNPLFKIEYRGYMVYDIDALVSSGQAAALGHGPGREGAYTWIDKKLDKHGMYPDGKFYPKPDIYVRDKMIAQNNAAYAVRKIHDDTEKARRAAWDAEH